jgi:xylulose-5-phosphate/fructose-6-phosphate phosphoketolase
MDAIDRLPQCGAGAVYVKQEIRDRLIDHKRYIVAHGDDMPEFKDWRWKQ